MFFEIEGIDGVGKSTQCLLLQEWMTRQGMEAVVVKELGSTFFGKQVRKLLLENGLKDGRAEMFLFLSCKSQVFSQIIMPYLAQGKQVISDRGSGSFICYNSSILGLGKDVLTNFLHIAMSGIEPNITILLDASVEIAMSRIETKERRTRFDLVGEASLRKQRNKFIELSNYFPHWLFVDGSASVQEVHLEIVKHVERALRGA